MGYVYLITNTVNNKRYVGQRICNDVNSRWNQHKRKDTKTVGKYLLSAYEKYGIDKFKFQIICVCFNEDCNKYEEEYIKKYNTLAPNGYNLTTGGNRANPYPKKNTKERKKLSDETKKRISEALLKRYAENPETKLLGTKNPNYKKPMSDEQKLKISETIKKNHLNNSILKSGKKISDKALDALKQGRENNKKSVGKFDMEGNFIEKYSSLIEAARKNNTYHQQIGKVCNGNRKYKSTGGFIWKFLSDETIS